MALRDLDSAHKIDVASVRVEPGAMRHISRALAVRYDVLPISDDGNQLTVVVPDQDDAETLEKIRFATGMHVRALSAPRDAIQARLMKLGGDLVPLLDNNAARTDPPAIALANGILAEAVAQNASDVHIEPLGPGGRVRQRIDGILHCTKTIDEDLFLQVVSRIKLLAGMDIADKRQPQDGRYNFDVAGRSFDARVSSVPMIGGEKLAIRLLADHARIPQLDQLGFPAEYFRDLQRVCQGPHGFIIAAGPTGSGKTTTLYAALGQRDAASENLCSVEDPIEIRMPGIAQVQVNARAGVTFASALRAFLRQDPNVIMVGEMRDQETAAVAASASLSGQLVLTTLHSNDAPGAVERLIELGVQRRTISAGLTAVVAQRLVRALCPNCRKPAFITSAVAHDFQIAEGTTIFKALGCDACGQTGYVGRLALFEILFVDDAIREAVSAGAPRVSLAAISKQRGMQPMFQHGLRRALAGETTLEELRRVLAIGYA